ncbi:MAG TPA: 4a-hydroxytetrahydrobiopterin dehydratase [Ilumatobacter sp.]|nr:4a-hydroxytetrahydrobiopterin dehydratase [Ilumatobacter sp.]
MESEPKRMNDDEVSAAIEQLDGWRLVDGKLSREYVFSDFVEAIGFMVRTSIWAQVINHHPEWSNIYNVVRVDLHTHDVGGISDYDFHLAAKMNELCER